MNYINIHFENEGSRIVGKFYPAFDVNSPPTLIIVPGWPGFYDDVLNLGAHLVEERINVLMFNPRGLFQSEGLLTHSNTLSDIGAALRWLNRWDIIERFNVDIEKIVLGGYSYGGGMALAYAARDFKIRKLISIASNDHGEFGREILRNAVFAESVKEWLLSTQYPKGPARFDLEYTLKEFIDHPETFGLRENADKLADRSILLIGGWEDKSATIEQYLLPFYRILKEAGAMDVTIHAYHADHSFSNVLDKLSSDISLWIHTQFNK